MSEVWQRVGAVLIGLVAFTGCQPRAQEPAPHADEPGQAAVTRLEDKAARISVVIHHPEKNERNVFYTFKKFGENYEDDDKQPVDAAKIDALKAAVDKDLIEADAIYGCRSVSKGNNKGRQIRIRFEKDGRQYVVMTASNCLNLAPFNVVIDGKRYVQLTGEIGRAVTDLLAQKNAFVQETAHNKAGFIDLTKPLDASLDETVATGAPILPHYAAIVAKDEALTALVNSRKLKADAPELSPSLEIGCNQTQNEACDKLVGRYTIPLSLMTNFSVAFTLTGDKVEAELPPSFEGAQRAFEQPVVRALVESAQAPVAVSWQSPDACPLIEALVPWFHAEQNKSSCETWTFTSADKTQTLIYYVRLDATWLGDTNETRDAALKPLLKYKALPKETRDFIRKLDQASKTPMNVFLDGNSKLYRFETKDGKTTCTTCKN